VLDFPAAERRSPGVRRLSARHCAPVDLLELVAINMKERYFQGSDLVSADAVTSSDGSPSISYKLRDDRAALYGDWSQKYIRHHLSLLSGTWPALTR